MTAVATDFSASEIRLAEASFRLFLGLTEFSEDEGHRDAQVSSSSSLFIASQDTSPSFRSAYHLFIFSCWFLSHQLSEGSHAVQSHEFHFLRFFDSSRRRLILYFGK
jgi:hypothetical protein